MRAIEFHSSLAAQLQRFVELRRAGGFDYQAQARLLLYFNHRDVSENPRSASPAGPEQPLQCGAAILRIPLANRPAMLRP